MDAYYRTNFPAIRTFPRSAVGFPLQTPPASATIEAITARTPHRQVDVNVARQVTNPPSFVQHRAHKQSKGTQHLYKRRHLVLLERETDRNMFRNGFIIKPYKEQANYSAVIPYRGIGRHVTRPLDGLLDDISIELTVEAERRWFGYQDSRTWVFQT